MLVWLNDKDGNPPPTIPNSDDENFEQKMKDVVEYHDKIIKCIVEEEEDPVMRDNLHRYQQHNCGFTCHKKKKKITIRAKEGHAYGEKDVGKMVELASIPICRFNYPRFPMDETKVLLGYTGQESEEDVKVAKKDYLAVRKYLIRQTYTPDNCKLEDQPNWQNLKKIDFKSFLKNVGMYSNISQDLSEADQFVQAKARYHDAMRAGIKGRASIFPRRNLSNLFTNNFNTNLMALHPANHDIQLCVDPYAVAQYVVGYLSKNESGISVLLKKVEEECSNLSSIQKINKLAAVLDKHREVSIQECVYRLLGLPMAKFSVKVKYLNTSKPEKRDGLLRNDLDNLDSDEAAFYPSPHQYYERLPDNWYINNDTTEVKKSELCLADWWSEYEHHPSGEPTGVDAIFMKDKKGWFKRRKERAVLRYYLPFDDEVELARGLCILFLPFDDEVRDIHKKDPVKLLAENHAIIDQNRRKFEKNNLINELISSLEREQEEDEESDNENVDCLEEETTNKYDLLEQQEAYDKQKARDALPKDDTVNNYLDPIELRKYITSLNPQQRMIFDDIMERVTAGDLEDKPFYCYIAGEAGTGKSHLLKLLIYAIRQLKIKSGQDLDKPSVIVMAPTANAAFLIKGKTIESALSINMSKYNTFSKRSADSVSQLAFEYEDVAAVICDEISMVGTNKLAAINYQMQALASGPQKNMFMGGKSFIAAGDLRQLPPVQDSFIFEKSNLDGRSSVAPCHWDENFKIYYLTQKMRCPDDIAFAELCDRVGTNTITQEDENFLKSRIVQETLPCEQVNENFTSGKVGIIVTTNARREEINLEKLRTLLPHREEYVCLSDDKITNKDKHTAVPETVSQSQTHGMIKNLIIREGAPVMITNNHKTARYKEDGIVNGAKGYIDYIQMSKKNPDIVDIIWVVFQNEEVGQRCYRREKMHLRPRGSEDYLHERALPILPSKRSFQVQQGNLHYVRKQFALTLAYAMTAHKCQGSTLDEVIVDFRGKNDKATGYIERGSFYVAITRVTEAKKLFLRNFERKHILVDPRVEYAINTMRKVRSYQMKKVYITEKIFENGDDIKVGYLNINNLLNGHHAEYINGDHNLRSLDVLTLAETHLTPNVSNEHIESVLTNWEVKFRFDSPDGKPHMGLLTLMPKKPHTKVNVHAEQSSSRYRDGQCQIQATRCQINKYFFSFVYCRTTPNIHESQWLMEKTADSHYIMGDLNLDPTVQDEKNKLKIICDKTKKSMLNEITTKNNVQLDHILGIELNGVKIFTTSFVNFISDHKSVLIRISDSDSNFIEDERLPKSNDDDNIIDKEVEEIQSQDDYLAMPPPSAQPPRKKRKTGKNTQ